MRLTTPILTEKPRRSLLSVPAINARALEKTQLLDCDGFIFDLEDSVAPEKKAEARENLVRFFAAVDLGARERIIRVNGLDTAEIAGDIEAVAACRPDAVLLPKVGGPDDLRRFAHRLNQAGLADSVPVWAMIETPRGVLNAGAVAECRQEQGIGLACLVVGLNDLRKETGVLPDPARSFLMPWLMQVVLAARAHGLAAIDSVSNDFKDIEAFSRECAQGRAMGFDGKMLIHPAQIAPANRHFGPSEAELAEARMIMAAFSDPAHAHLNVVNVDGRMIERLHLEQAERLIARFRMIDNSKDQDR